MNDEDKRKLKIGILIAAFTVLLYLGFQHMNIVLKTAGAVLQLLSPFLLGICFAFVLNIPMRFIETKVFKKLNQKNSPKWKKIRRPLCLSITILLFFGLLAAISFFIGPPIIQSAKRLGENIPSYLDSLQNVANQFLGQIGISTDLNQAITSFLTQFSDKILSFLSSVAPQVTQYVMNTVSGIVNSFLGFVVGIYMLATKEHLVRNVKSLVYAFLPLSAANMVTHIYRVSRQRFFGFVTGQLTEAFILGVLCFATMSIAGMEYVPLISIIIAITNVVPIIGPIIGTIPGALIMLMVDPMKAVIFVILIIILQQIEANFIYPRVVGDSIGLPGLWVLFSVLVGGGLFGLPGVLLGVPVFSVFYTLLAEIVFKRLKERKMKIK